MTKSIKRRLLKAKITLNHTIHKILQINHSRKRLPYLEDGRFKERALNEELKVLNKIAAQQARLVRHYEETLAGRSRDDSQSPNGRGEVFFRLNSRNVRETG